MKLRCSQPSLAEATSAAIVAVETKTISPGLSSFMIEAQDDKLVITSGGYECAVKAAITDADISQVGAFVVPARAFTDLVRSIMPEKTIELEINPAGSRLLVRASPFRASLAGSSTESFHVQNWAPNYTVEADPAQFSRAVTSALTSVASEKIGKAMPYLRGVEMILENNKLSFISSDSYRASIARIDVQDISTQDKERQFRIIVPASTLSLAAGRAETEPVVIGYTENKAYFKVGDIEIQSSLLSGTYPDILDRLLAIAPQSVFETGSMELITALNQVIAVIRGLGNRVVVSFEPDCIRLDASSDYGEAEVLVDGISNGPATGVSLSGLLLMEAVRSMSSGSVSIGIPSGEREPVIITPLDDFDYKHYLMPMWTAG